MNKEQRQFKLDRIIGELGVDWPKVAKVPLISPILKEIGPVARVVDLLRMVDDPDARRVVFTFDSLDQGEKDIIPVEVLCAALDISSRKVLGMVVDSAFLNAKLQGDFLAAIAHPKVVGKTIERALTDQGDKDRKLLLQHQQFLPMPKNQVVQIFGDQNIDARQQEQHNTINVLPTLESGAKKLADRFNDRLRELPPPPLTVTSEVILDGDLPDEDDDPEDEE